MTDEEEALATTPSSQPDAALIAAAEHWTNEYRDIRPTYEACAKTVKDLLETAFGQRSFNAYSVESRAKSLQGFRRKASKAEPNDPQRPKYDMPLQQITDLAGVRVITFFLDDIQRVAEIIGQQFERLEYTDKSQLLRERQSGYRSHHFLVRFASNRSDLPEYSAFKGLTVEIQVRTILQHSWAEIEHDVQYTLSGPKPRQIQDRFTSLAGLLEIADREFQAIADQDQALRDRAVTAVAEDRLDDIELTAQSLKLLLDEKLGPDGRMKQWGYRDAVTLLHVLGFTNLRQVERALSYYNTDKLSRIVSGGRQGQLTRLEYSVAAALGDKFVERHPWSGNDWFTKQQTALLEKVRRNGLVTDVYDPAADD